MVLEHNDSYPFIMESEGCYQEYSSVSEFKENMTNDYLSSKKSVDGWVFWSPAIELNSINGSNISDRTIREKIIFGLTHVMEYKKEEDWLGLVQFWVPILVGGRCYLTTSSQPFAVKYLYKGICSYRKMSTQHLYLVDDAAEEEQLGPPGRVFRSGHPESSPDLRSYSNKEFPLRDHAASCGLITYLAVPVFDLNRERCIGVLEHLNSLVPKKYPLSVFQIMHRALKVAKMRSTQEISVEITGDQQRAFIDINKMLEVVIMCPELVVASVWIPCNQLNELNIEMRCLKLAKFSVNLLREDTSTYAFVKAYKSYNVRPLKGFIGRVLESEYKMCFCENFCDFSIAEEPLAHYAQAAGFGVWFAICLESKHTGSNLYVLELILCPRSKEDEYPESFLCSLFSIMKNTLKSLKVASGHELGRDLIFEATEFSTDIERTYSELFQMGSLPHRFETGRGNHEVWKYYSEKQMYFNGMDDDRNMDRVQEHNINVGGNAKEQEQNITNANSMEGKALSKHNRDEGNMGLHVSYEVLKSHFGKKLEDVAEELGVGTSTLKGKCREYGIKRWPCNRKNEMNPSLFQTTSSTQVQDFCQKISKPSSSNLPISHLPIVQPNVPHTSTGSTGEVDKTCQETKMVTVKAKFEDNTIKFKMCLSSGMERLVEEVSKRLDLKIGSFKLKYSDEDDLVLLTCDEDLHLYGESMRSLGKTTILVLVHPISN